MQQVRTFCITKTIVTAISTTNEEVTIDTTYVGALATDQICWQVTILMEGVNVVFKLDSGAEVTAISSETYQI